MLNSIHNETCFKPKIGNKYRKENKLLHQISENERQKKSCLNLFYTLSYISLVISFLRLFCNISIQIEF